MFFYIFNKIGHKLKSKDDLDGAVNTRTLLLGGIAYILVHALIFTPGSSLYFYRHYLTYLFLLDCFVMGIEYKLYYGRNIMHELNPYETDEFDEKTHKYHQPKSESKIHQTPTDPESSYEPPKLEPDPEFELEDNAKSDNSVLPNETLEPDHQTKNS